MSKRKTGRSPLRLLVGVVAVAVVLLFASAAIEVGSTMQGRSYHYDIRDYLYSVESGRFGSLYETAARDMGKDASRDAEVEECRALAFYYEQAALEHAFRATGDTAQADAFAARMGEYEAQLGSLAPKAETVRSAVTG